MLVKLLVRSWVCNLTAVICLCDNLLTPWVHPFLLIILHQANISVTGWAAAVNTHR